MKDFIGGKFCASQSINNWMNTDSISQSKVNDQVHITVDVSRLRLFARTLFPVWHDSMQSKTGLSKLSVGFVKSDDTEASNF